MTKHTVLIADDERMVRISLRTMIERDTAGFTVVGEAHNGEEALQLASDLKPDLLITDIRMPGLDGLELIRSLSERGASTEFIVVSGYGDFEYAQSALRFGVADYLLKPIDPDYMMSTLRKMGNRIERKSGNATSRQWMWTWKLDAERMAKWVWQLEEHEVRLELERLRALIMAASGPDLSQLQEKLAYYLVVLNGELEQMGQGSPPLPIVQLPAGPMGNEKLYEALDASLAGVLEHIRNSRNWWSYNRMLKNVSAYIEEHFMKPDLTVKEVASHFEISPNYFGILFKREAGMSLNQYLTRLRIEKAMAYLKNPTVKVYEVGERVGFEDYSYFSKTFKKYTGVTPSEFRKYDYAGGIRVDEDIY
ncbi:MAG: two component transcriptional regulator, AraC family protein [Paenibacillus sp.]|jgi:two-component system response regulator YesN|nr:two component transcriptional regulator, AraC family protein [Paenibacillus sp.]